MSTPPTTRKSFVELGISPWLVKTCHEMGIRHPTEIQVQCIPPILQGKDVVGRAKTGSGKTAAFALPILEKLSRDPFGIFAIVLTPTRELAFQIAEQFKALGSTMTLREAVVVGGMDILTQAKELSNRPHIVIATPGRLAWHISNGTQMHLEHLQFLVLDEADRLFEDTFKEDMEVIMNALPPKEERQTLMFSATITEALVAAQSENMVKPEFFQAGISAEPHAVVETLDQRYLFVPQNIKECYLVWVLSQPQYANTNASVIVFTSTCRGCEIISELLLEMKIDCVSLHSRKSQARRLAALGKFRSGKTRVLVATDVASRGLDIPTVQLVINYDVPRLTDDYIHRVGRTARAGRGGVALTMVSQYDIEIFKAIEAFIGKEMQEYEHKEEQVLELLKKVNQAKKVVKLRLEQTALTAQQQHRNLVSLQARRKKRDGEEGTELEASAAGPDSSDSAASGRQAKRKQSEKTSAASSDEGPKKKKAKR